MDEKSLFEESKVTKKFKVKKFWCFFFSSRRRHTRWTGDWSSDVCSSDLPLASNSPVRRESLRLYFVARAFGYAANVLLLRPFLPAVNLSISQPTAARVGAMSPMQLLRFHDGGSQDRMGYLQVVHFRHLQTADFISKLRHSVQSRMLYPNSVIA